MDRPKLLGNRVSFLFTNEREREKKKEKEKEKERIEQQPWRSFVSGQRLIQTNIPRLSASQIRA